MRYCDLIDGKGTKIPCKMPLCVKVKNKIYSLEEKVVDGIELKDIEFLNTEDPNANRSYERTLCFLLSYAIDRVFNNNVILKIEHSISQGLYCELFYKEKINNSNKLLKIDKEILFSIKEELLKIVEEKIDIKKETISCKKATEIFEKQGDLDKVILLQHCNIKKIDLYKINDYYGYFYGSLLHNSNLIKLFDLVKYKDGFVLLYPSISEAFKVPKFKKLEKLYEIFNETGKWNKIIGVENVGNLNNEIKHLNSKRLVLISEGLHEKKYLMVSDKITHNKDIKIVLIAGPSSSGKTTSSKRLSIQLMVNGVNPIAIEMDNYFVNRVDTPKLEDGSYDFESFYAIEHKLFNKDIKDLIEGKEIVPPVFNFKTGIREKGTKKMKLPKDGILIIEGIHALNPCLLENIDRKYKFKIYASALTQLNMDNHNRISTTDVRKIRRIVRDHRTRGYSSEETLRMFKSVTRGEKQNIFPFQDEADVMFNTTLIYELSVLKKHVLPLLETIKEDEDVYLEAQRLMTMLQFIDDIDEELVPKNSILREFIGNSFFD